MNPYPGGAPPPQAPPPFAPPSGARPPSGTRPSFEGRPSSTKTAGPSVARIAFAGCGVLVLLGAIGVTLWYLAAIAADPPAAKPKTTATTPSSKAPPAPVPTSVPGKR